MRRSDRGVSDFSQIEEIIRNAEVCRIALANDNIPYIVTMNFGYVANPDRKLYFHCASQGRKLEMLRSNNYVCFQMDTNHQLIKGPKSCDWGMNYSSILGYGNIFVVTEKEEKIAGLNSIMAHYGKVEDNNYGENVFEQTTVLRLDILEMTGKKKF
jgi:nitroimidazol reductase NimA-like FMN-containing flavoprotein (pyridoxamine 5'-phosphate oxidase superfamily)